MPDRSAIKQLLLQRRLRAVQSVALDKRLDQPGPAHSTAASLPALPKGLPIPAGVWKAALEAARQEAQQASLALALPALETTAAVLDRCCLPYVVAAWQSLGIFRLPGEQVTVDGLLERLAIRPDYRKAVYRLLLILVEAGYLEQGHDQTFRCVRPLPAEPPDARLLLEAAREQVKAMPFLVDFIQRSGEKLVDVLTGRLPATQLLFNDGQTDLADQLYRDSPPFLFCNRVAQAVVKAVVQSLPTDRPLQLLEIGAGTGATTAFLLPVLPSGRTTYLYSDISTYFLEVARQKFAAYPFLYSVLLDIERDPQEQGFGSHQFDVVIAAHVLHATRSIQETLRHVHSLLTDKGILILMEETKFHRFFNLTMGLQTGFDHFIDEEVRKMHPLLASNQWLELLRRHGFEDVEVLPTMWGVQLFLATAW